MRKVFVAVLVLGLGACTRAIPITDTEGERVWMIECGAAVSFSVCHTRAQKMCPGGYATLSEDAGFNRKEVRVRCLPPKDTADQAPSALSSTTAPGAPKSAESRLRDLQSLFDKGLITEQEYETRRHSIIGAL
ncbi:hypothetical protein ABAZ39_03865 [Azospirillum argentinense]|uniref:SHOCT domain-containing protein n=1 Tax=Azospirillum argentinense TaxID=2970906 RepID=A0A060DEN8_9PROT|nr:SHOCT domain-containing protein [Azospirillum argentinense]AIB11165.1 hypothetical protein ABAZ39_03865 [Azospirillum argentinense]EZQ08115.1 hypothetical protein ABAZ39_05290 [Azospirillum argentinense]